MNWDQIEDKWAEMARRVRADWMTDEPEAAAKSVRRRVRPDGRLAGLSERTTGTVFQTLDKSSDR